MYLALKILLDWIGIGSSSNELNGPIDVAPSLAVGVTATATNTTTTGPLSIRQTRASKC